jgi:hypothetical protein
VVSGRTVSLEFPLLELYQLVFPRGYSLLDAKLRAQGTVNILVSLAAAFPFFLLLRPGFQTFSALYFMAATVIFVPVLTALALALGTYFPDLSPGPSVLGMRLKGLLLYSLMAVILYSFLLNRMYMATVLYGVFLILVISPLYLGARRRLDSSMERWAH